MTYEDSPPTLRFFRRQKRRYWGKRQRDESYLDRGIEIERANEHRRNKRA
jgi:hypothetical protein